MVKNLKAIRNKKGISQQTLASAIGLTQQSINMYENHKIEPDIDTLIEIANYFNVTVDYLIGRTDENGNILTENTLAVRYAALSKAEKLCVDTLMDTYIKLKNQA